MNLAIILALLFPLTSNTFHRPNVLVVILDDVGKLDTDAIPTPVLDALGSIGTTFSRGYAGTWCQPCRGSFYLSAWVTDKVGATCEPPISRTPEHCAYNLPRMMADAGYSTALFGKWHYGTTNLPVGDQEYVWRYAPHEAGFDAWRAGVPGNVQACLEGGSDYYIWRRVDDAVVVTEADFQPLAMREAFLVWVAIQAEPWLAVYSMQLAHFPFQEMPAEVLPPGWTYSAAPDDREYFEAMVATADRELGEILYGVDLTRTAVFVFGDNGTPKDAEAPGQSPNRVKHSTYEGGVHVPFLAYVPGTPPRSSDQVVHVADLLPTLAELAGGALDASVQGQSLLPAMVGATLARGWIYVSKKPHNAAQSDQAIIESRWKGKWSFGDDAPLVIFDLLLDPLEATTLDPDAPENRTTATRLWAELALATGAG